ncbi:myelin-associated glycoprotein-like [Perca fluviatilis]|uniref:myelin-associated glycoprotein-like n=1 Tax=Perca fluviatilis TaxID=8168 RepID=UPI0019644F40|nr:myelin-associated glycoprotein-like [Perca fluviatilis]
MGTAHLLRLLRLFTGISMLQQVRSWSIAVPKTITAVEGSCVVLPCQTQPHSRVIWYQYHNRHYPVVYDGRHPTAVEDQFRGRTSVLGEAAEGNCTLLISNVKLADDNLKVYVWIDPDSKQTQKFYHQTVTVFVERKSPIIAIQKQIVDGEMFQANCSVKYSCPFSPPSLHWNTGLFLKNSTSMTLNDDVQDQWLYTKILHGLATYEMHNSKMWCSAEFRSFATKSQQITLNILYEPVTVTLLLEKEPVMEGGSVTLECAANCNPQPHTYIWLRRQMGQTNEITSTERKRPFNNITRDTSLSCIAHNDIGTGKSDWLDLDVQYAPVILPESFCHLTGGVLKCVCQAEASPNASIYWTIDGNEPLPSSFSIVSTNKKNVVSGIIRGPGQSQSNISCRATNALGSDTIQLSAHLQTSSLYMWLSALLLLGIGLLFGCALFIYRKYSRNRSPPDFLCNTDILLRPQHVTDNVQPEQICSSPHRSQDLDAQSSPCRPESNSEVDRLSCVYDNDFVAKMSRPTTAQQHQENATAAQREDGIQPQAKSVDCSTDVYLNCWPEGNCCCCSYNTIPTSLLCFFFFFNSRNIAV